MPIAAVVADANVLLSATIGKAALRVLTECGVVAHTSEFNASEVERYLPRLASKYELPEALVLLQWRALPLLIHPRGDYASEIEDAVASLKGRDTDDTHPLALARALELPLWSSDRDLAHHGVKCYPTARLLALLKRQHR